MRILARAAWFFVLTPLALVAHAAGGHHEVDDATVLDPGRCQVEAWAIDGRQPALRALHLGSACRFGPIEWGLGLDGLRQGGKGATSAGPQLKWVSELIPQRLAVGFVTGTTWQLHGKALAVTTTYVPMTAWLGPGGSLQLHANLGQDREAGVGVRRRWGVAMDWSVDDKLLLTAERRSQLAQALTRCGARWNLTPLSSLDFSVGRGSGATLIAIGFSQEWQR